VKQVLVVAHDHSLRTTLGLILGGLGATQVIETSSAEPAMSALENGVDAAFVSAGMPDQLALRVARDSTRFCPTPVIIVVSQGPHPDLFALGQAGARAHLTWPATPDEVLRCLKTHRTADELELSVRSLVGRVGIKDAQDWFRGTMLRQALEASHGSRRGAARLLGVTRPAIQRMLREEADDNALLESARSPTVPAPPARRSSLRPIASPSTADQRGTKRRRPA
jgi:DNA-binding NtrC family response regulator